MKNITRFALFIFVVSGSNLVTAQEPPHSRRWEARKLFDEQAERRHFMFDETDLLTNKPNYQSLSADEVTTLSAIIPDFQVNENAGPNGAYQGSPAISTDGSGNFVITWSDSRNGDSDIYAQRYASDGTALASNFKVNDDQVSASQGSPAISPDGSGNFVITWPDSRNGDSDIYAQRYASDGTALASNFRVNDDDGLTYQYVQYDPSISTDGSGNFVITWSDERNDWLQTDIYAQRYASDGTALASNFKVNDDQGSEDQGYPAISTDGSGSFVITWYDRRNGDYDIYAQRYASDGTALASNFKVNDDQGRAYQNFPSISTDGSGNFVITWTDSRNYDSDIYAQRYASDGTALASNFKVNHDQGSAYQKSPDVTLWNNRIYTAWTDNRAGGYNNDIWANVLDFTNPVGVDISEHEQSQVPSKFALHQNYPNPFNPTTKISYTTPKSNFVTLKIFDRLGREIQTLVNQFQEVNTYIVNFDASGLASGIYFYRIQAGNSFVETKKMLFMK